MLMLLICCMLPCAMLRVDFAMLRFSRGATQRMLLRKDAALRAADAA